MIEEDYSLKESLAVNTFPEFRKLVSSQLQVGLNNDL
jgi:hypothetical protein